MMEAIPLRSDSDVLTSTSPAVSACDCLCILDNRFGWKESYMMGGKLLYSESHNPSYDVCGRTPHINLQYLIFIWFMASRCKSDPFLYVVFMRSSLPLVLYSAHEPVTPQMTLVR